MVSFNKAQTGARVYAGARTAPNKGPVSAAGAQGYLKRELAKKNGARPVGGDGKSDSRSGVASAALGRMLGNNGPRGQAQGRGPNRGQNSILGPQASAPPPPAANSNSPSGLPAPMIPQVQINANGILELPYNQNLSAEGLAAVEESNQGLLDLNSQEQQIALEAAQGRRDAEIAFGQMNQQNLSGNAAGGTAFSSKYGKAVSDTATSYTNTLSDISNRESQTKADIANRRAAIQASLNQQLAQAAQSYANDMNEDAGDYGFGQGYGQQGERNTGRNNGGGKKNPPKKNNPPKKHNDPPKRGSGGGPVKGKKR